VPKRVGVLALQGDFEAHERALECTGARTIQVRTPDELSQIDALVIPGGESTTMLKLLDATGLKPALAEFGRSKPIFGTCAGAILVAREVINPAQESFGFVDIGVARNAYGRQLDSRIVRIRPEATALPGGDLEAVFIRAPIIRRTGPSVRVLASYNGDPVLVEEGHHLVATFHPELTADTRVHQRFVDTIEK
jgi:5'-phosphate synthase pdxT subunit